LLNKFEKKNLFWNKTVFKGCAHSQVGLLLQHWVFGLGSETKIKRNF